MIDIQNEQSVSLSGVARRLPSNRGDRPVHPSAVLRWVLHGIATPTGLIKLEAVKVAGRWLTTWQAVERFIAAQQPQTSPMPMPRPPAGRQRAVERAQQRLKAIGI